MGHYATPVVELSVRGEKKNPNCCESPVCSSSTYFIHMGQILSDFCSKLVFVQTRVKKGSVGLATEAVRASWSDCPVLLDILFMQEDYWLSKTDLNARFILDQHKHPGGVRGQWLGKDDFWRRLRSGPTTVKSVSRNSISQAEVMRLWGHCASLSLSAPLHVKHSDYLFIFTLNPSLSQGRALI